MFVRNQEFFFAHPAKSWAKRRGKRLILRARFSIMKFRDENVKRLFLNCEKSLKKISCERVDKLVRTFLQSQ